MLEILASTMASVWNKQKSIEQKQTRTTNVFARMDIKATFVKSVLIKSLKKGIFFLFCFIFWFSEIDRCSESPCINGGICHRLPGGGKFTCECALGFHGVLCDQNLNVCEFGVCRNNAQCIDGLGANYTCICAPGYTGQSCQIDINECESQPCMHGGECVESEPGTYECKCTTNKFTGKNCEIVLADRCRDYCMNNGTCQVSELLFII